MTMAPDRCRVGVGFREHSSSRLDRYLKSEMQLTRQPQPQRTPQRSSRHGSRINQEPEPGPLVAY